jgi:hypothetical protein
MSLAVPSARTASPRREVRRMSDQDTARARHGDEAERLARTLALRLATREREADDMNAKSKASSPLQPSPLTLTLTPTFSSDGRPASNRTSRRSSVVDGSLKSNHPSRIATIRHSGLSIFGTGRTPYNSSPLVPKPPEHMKQDPQAQHAGPGAGAGEHHGLEGTDSSASTAAPSSVWDELDDLKSRIHRLELTGKLPPTSGAAMSRATDERPPTATTAATTMSVSPKQEVGGTDRSVVQQAETASTVSSTQRNGGQPVLQSALSKSRPLLAPHIYSALETAATDAIALSNLVGTVGQPGPISSGASAIGDGATVTDRQLRRKAKSVCVSLTELCLALSEHAAQGRERQSTAPPPAPAPPEVEVVAPMSPMVRFTGIQVPRRSSTVAGSALASPRTMSRFEEKRSNMLTTSSRYFANFPMPSIETTAATAPGPSANPRRSSLMVSRPRRAESEEPDEQQVGRKTSMLRTRRAGTEEPADHLQPHAGRKTSSYLRRSRDEPDYADDDHRLRAPSRAVTEVARSSRPFTSNVPLPTAESNLLASSAIPRRRIPSSESSTRTSQSSAPAGQSARRHLDRSHSDRDMDDAADGEAQERAPRHFPLSNMVSRASSLKRSNRDSMITNNSTTAQAGAYR